MLEYNKLKTTSKSYKVYYIKNWSSSLKYPADQRVDQRITESYCPRQYLDIPMVAGQYFPAIAHANRYIKDYPTLAILYQWYNSTECTLGSRDWGWYIKFITVYNKTLRTTVLGLTSPHWYIVKLPMDMWWHCQIALREVATLGQKRFAIDVIKYAAVMMVYLTKWAEISPTRDQMSLTIVWLLVEHVVLCHGVPVELLSDRGATFLSKVMLIAESL